MQEILSIGKCIVLVLSLVLPILSVDARDESSTANEVINLLKRSELDSAGKLLKSTLKTRPDESDLWALMTFCSDEPLKCAEKSVHLNNKSALALIALGLAKHNKQGQNAGIEELNEAIKLAPSSLTYNSRGRVLLNNGEIGEEHVNRAIADFSRAIQLDHKSIVSYLLRGDAYFQKGSTSANMKEQENCLQQAIENYSAALTLDPRCADAYILRGQAYDWVHDKRCIDDFSKAIELNPNQPSKVTDHFQLFFPDCLPYITESFGIPSNLPNAYALRANAYKKTKQYSKALPDLTYLINLRPEPYLSAYKDRADIYLELKEYSKAIADYSLYLAGLEKTKKDQKVQEEVWQRATAANRSMSYAKRAAAHAALKHLKDAKDDASRSIELIEKYSVYSIPAAEPYFIRGEIFSIEKNHQKAIADYSKGLQFNPAYGTAYINRASAHYALGQYKDAATDYDKALNMGSNGADLYMIRGKCFLEMGEHEKALADFEKARILEPQSLSVRGRYYRNRADLYSRKNEHKKAIDDLTQLITSNRSNVDAYRMRANEYIKTSDFAHAAMDFLHIAILKPLWFSVLLVPILAAVLLKPFLVRQKTIRNQQALP